MVSTETIWNHPAASRLRLKNRKPHTAVDQPPCILLVHTQIADKCTVIPINRWHSPQNPLQTRCFHVFFFGMTLKWHLFFPQFFWVLKSRSLGPKHWQPHSTSQVREDRDSGWGSSRSSDLNSSSCWDCCCCSAGWSSEGKKHPIPGDKTIAFQGVILTHSQYQVGAWNYVSDFFGLSENSPKNTGSSCCPIETATNEGFNLTNSNTPYSY